MPAPEEKARHKIDEILSKAGWVVQDYKSANIHAGNGVVLRNFPLTRGHGFADYLLYVDGKAAGVIEAKKEGVPLTGVEIQAVKYSEGLPLNLPAHVRPLPFLYQSTGIETRFTNGLDPEPRSRGVFAFHRPETFIEWLDQTVPAEEPAQEGLAAYRRPQYRKATTQVFHIDPATRERGQETEAATIVTASGSKNRRLGSHGRRVGSYAICWIAESNHFPFRYRMKVQTSLDSVGFSSLP